MTPLPIDKTLPEITEALRQSRNLVLVAPPGAGKSTRVPPAILRSGLLSKEHPNLVMLQPRRVAARTIAARIADENGLKLGNEVGYHVRFDRAIGPDTRLRVLTEGILTRQLLDDPFLEGIGAVLLDEFHERSLFTDVAVALLREVQQTVRPDLMLIIMSATLEAEPASRFLGDCPIVRAEGRTYPIEILYTGAVSGYIPDRAVNAVENVFANDLSQTGDVLVFLPGAEEIRRSQRMLETLAQRNDVAVLPLYGSLSAEEQNLAIRPSRQRKIILATNIAETSLTIDGVRTVVDTGYARVASYDADRGLDRLDLQRISKASATQRAGRAGRTAPGRCIRLWSEKEQNSLEDFDLPDVRRVDLSGTVLSLHAWGKPDVRAFGWYEKPDDETIVAAEKLLTMLGALTAEANGEITPLGKKLASLPIHPRLARLLVASADEGLLSEGATLAALMSEKDILINDRAGAKTHGKSDLLYRMMQLDVAERARFSSSVYDSGIDSAAARQVAKARDDLLRVARSLKSSREPPTDTALLKLPLNAYPDRVCRRRENNHKSGVMVGGGGVRLADQSTVLQGELFLAIDARPDSRSAAREAMVRVASLVKTEWLTEMFPQSIRVEKGAEFDEKRNRIVGYRRTWYRDLLLDENRDITVNASDAGEALAVVLKAKARSLFEADESARGLLARVSVLRKHMPEQPWPAFEDHELGEILAENSAGRKSVDEVVRGSLAQMLRNRLHYPLDRLLDEHAPESVLVPSGNHIRLEYAGDVPVLAVRLQELFGMTQTPHIANGRLKVRLHLLGPNYRPVQVTDDLQNFWATTYFQVRKDLRARYPKHKWPDDPLTAQAEARGRPRR